MGELKTCIGCNQPQPPSEFHKNKNHSDGLSSYCKKCACEIARTWREQNKERAVENSRRYYAENKEEYLRKCREYRQNNREKVSARNRRYRQKNGDTIRKRERDRYASEPEVRERLIQNAARWRRNNRERRREIVSKWSLNNRDKVTAKQARRRARVLNADGTYTADEFNALVRHYGPRCLCCGKKRKLESDHVIALSNGGSNSIENIQPLCHPCNASKGNLRDTDYRPDGGAFARKLAKRKSQ